MDRVEALRRLSNDKSPQTLGKIIKLVASKAFAKRDADEVKLTLRTLTTLGGMRALRVLTELAERKPGMFGGKDTKKVAAAAKESLLALKNQGK